MICRYAVCVLIISITLLINLGIVSASEQDEKKDLIKGTAIVAVRTGSVAGLGHVGVAFQNADGTWTAGAIEGAPEKSLSNLGGLLVLPSGDEGAWSKKFNTREEVENEFLRLDYDKLKEIYVDNSNPDRANKEIEKFESAGYLAPFNDCLTRTDDVLRAYGVNTNMNPFGVVTSVTGPIGAAARLTSDVVPNVYFYSIPGKEISLKSNDAQVDHSFGDQNDLGGINFTSIKLNYISLSADSSGGVNFDLGLKAKKAEGTSPGIDVINSTLIGATAFMTGLAIPSDKFWVNLNPWEPDRIIDEQLSRSDVGRIMLEADLQMKKDICNYENPCTNEVGVALSSLRDEKHEILVRQCMNKFPGEIEDVKNIVFRPVTRYWIVPDSVYAYSNGTQIYIINATLAIQSESVPDRTSFRVDNQDVKKLSKGCLEELNKSSKEYGEYYKEMIDQMILPFVVADVNHGEKYEDLREVFVSLALVQWYKSNINSRRDIFRESLDSSDSPLNAIWPWNPHEIWENFVYSYENGEYKCYMNTTTKTAAGAETVDILIRSSGGVAFHNINDKLVVLESTPPDIQETISQAIADGFIDKGTDVFFGIRMHGEMGREKATPGSDSLKNVDRRDPSLAITWNNKGNKLNDQGKYDDAIEAYEEAIRLDPSSAIARSNLAITWNNKGNKLNDQGKYDDAIEAFEEAIRLDPKSASAWLGKGVALYWQMKDSEALQCFDEAIRLNPDLAVAWNNKGIILESLGRASEADAAYSRARELG